VQLSPAASLPTCPEDHVGDLAMLILALVVGRCGDLRGQQDGVAVGASLQTNTASAQQNCAIIAMAAITCHINQLAVQLPVCHTALYDQPNTVHCGFHCYLHCTCC
jgi:hypothetical protein